jgi:hypothetical protein
MSEYLTINERYSVAGASLNNRKLGTYDRQQDLKDETDARGM